MARIGVGRLGSAASTTAISDRLPSSTSAARPPARLATASSGERSVHGLLRDSELPSLPRPAARQRGVVLAAPARTRSRPTRVAQAAAPRRLRSAVRPLPRRRPGGLDRRRPSRSSASTRALRRDRIDPLAADVAASDPRERRQRRADERARSASRSTLPPLMMHADALPGELAPPCARAAAKPRQPVGSTTIFMRSAKKRMASTSCGVARGEHVVDVAADDRRRCSSPRCWVCAPSAMVCGRVDVHDARRRGTTAGRRCRPRARRRRPGSAGASARAASAEPDEQAAAAQATNSASSGPTSSNSSFAAVPWPAITSGWS